MGGVAALLLVAGTVSPVLAAAPGNDDIGSPTVVAAIPYSDGPYSTTEATPGTGDPSFCYDPGGPGDAATVWYSYTAADSGLLQADTLGSDYDTTLYVGAPNGEGGIDVISCNDDTFGVQSVVSWDANAGSTYLFVVGTCCGGAGQQGGGGNLVFNLAIAPPPPPPPTIDITIDGTGSFTPSGAAVIHGTVSCTGLLDKRGMDLSVRQRVGRVFISGSGMADFSCEDGPTAWTATVAGDNGRFAGGQAQVHASAFGCGQTECVFDEATVQVRLRR